MYKKCQISPVSNFIFKKSQIIIVNSIHIFLSISSGLRRRMHPTAAPLLDHLGAAFARPWVLLASATACITGW